MCKHPNSKAEEIPELLKQVRQVWIVHRNDDDRQQVYDALADNLARRTLQLATQRVWSERAGDWQNAYDKSGKGSTFVRARIIANDIYVPAAPIPDVTPSPDQNQFLHQVVSEVEAAAQDVGVVLK